MYTHKTDYLIIGGGIIGTTAAYLLSKIDKNVILADMDFIGSGSTGLSAGTILCVGNGKIDDYNVNMKTKELIFIGRRSSASPATGVQARHTQNQKNIIDLAIKADKEEIYDNKDGVSLLKYELPIE